MKLYKRILKEEWYQSFKGGFSSADKVDVYKNISRKELIKFGKDVDNISSYLLSNGDIYSWKHDFHINIMRNMKPKIPQDAIPVIIYFYRNEAEVTVTDSSKGTKWHHNPNAAKAIKSHRHMNKLFKKINVSYYDDAIVGDWEEL